jgi:diaminohydroxyphosphoribosylaminopyrimidine deaminase/5-amino-6-(5-phosphoribosylamino)uracil reductase
MSLALDLAARGRCGASPNPMVGAVVLDAEGEMVGSGYHARCGGPHAEVNALKEAGERARGGTIFVTLEPCSHYGRTPPCCNAIIDAGINRVVMAMRDPTPTAGGGCDRLIEAGIDVVVGPGEGPSRQLNRRWLRSVSEGRPWITLKAGVSLDGRIATRIGESQWITSEAARRRGLELREEHDAILVGISTVLADNPRLTRRLNMNPEEAWLRIVLDSTLRIPSECHLVADEPETTLVVHTNAAARSEKQRLRDCGVQTLEVRASADGRIELEDLLPRLARIHISALMVEGGAEVHGSFVDHDLYDEAVLFVAPMILGGAAPPAVGGLGIAHLRDAPRLQFDGVERIGTDVELRVSRRDEPETDDVHRVG